MVQKHSGSRISHDSLCLFSHIRLVTVNATFSACSFVFLERASVQTKSCIFDKFVALSTELLFPVVLGFAVDVNHGFDGFLFTSYPWMFMTFHLFVLN